ncbi:hypothetical protein Tco_0888520 [Tanacetum coccineum]
MKASKVISQLEMHENKYSTALIMRSTTYNLDDLEEMDLGGTFAIWNYEARRFMRIWKEAGTFSVHKKELGLTSPSVMALAMIGVTKQKKVQPFALMAYSSTSSSYSTKLEVSNAQSVVHLV